MEYTGQEAIIEQEAFLETVKAVTEIVKASEALPSKEEIAIYFEGMDLSEKQQEMVYEYLKEQQKRGWPGSGRPLQKDGKNGPDVVGIELEKQGMHKTGQLQDTDFFRLYQEELQGIERCTLQEEQELYGRLAAGDKDALQKLLEQWMPRVLEYAKGQLPSIKDLADVVQEGNIGILLTLNRYLGCGRQMDFQKILRKSAKGAMEAYIQKAGMEQEMDHSLLAKVSLVYEAQKFLAEELQRMPKMEELSQYTRLPESELEAIFALSEKEN